MSKKLIIGIDHGFRNMKTREQCFPSAITEIADIPSEPGGMEDILIYREKIYTINAPNLSAALSHDKTASPEYYLLTLAAIAKQCKPYSITEGNLYIAAGLPQAWYLKQKESFREFLLAERNLKFQFAGIHYHFHLEDVSVFAQGQAAAINYIVSHRNQDFLVVDIGGETLDLLFFQNGKLSINESRPSDKAMIYLHQKISDVILSETETPLTGNSFIENYVNTGSRDEKPKNPFLTIIQKELIAYTELVFRIIAEHGFSLDILPVVFVGGGARVIRKFGDFSRYYDVSFEEDIHANAKGYERFENIRQRKR